MYFFIAMTCSFIGMILILQGTPIKQSHMNRSFINTDVWIEHISTSIQKTSTLILKFIIVHSIDWYHRVTQNMTIQKKIKQRIKTLLYEHYRERKNFNMLQKPDIFLKIKKDAE